jgi:transposase-like protein
MRRRAKPGRTVLLCPKCGSVRVSLIAGSIVGQVYHCQKCDYMGSLVFETEVRDDGTPAAPPPTDDA